jgi:hypothetical protein
VVRIGDIMGAVKFDVKTSPQRERQRVVAGRQRPPAEPAAGVAPGFEGTAIAIAMSGSALPSDKRFAVTTNWGNFRGTNAMSLVAQARVSDDVVANAGFAGGFQYGGYGTRAGLTFAW